MGIHEKGSEDFVSAVCYTIYTIYLSLCTQTAETTPPEPFSLNSLYNLLFLSLTLLLKLLEGKNCSLINSLHLCRKGFKKAYLFKR